jgi:flagellar basal body-associated protein FliL
VKTVPSDSQENDKKERHGINKMKMLMRKQFLMGFAAVFFVMASIWVSPIVSHADTTGTVKAESVIIREKADSASTVIGSSSQGAQITIKGQTSDASGTLWYQVYVDANTLGYIRADLISADGTVSNLQTADTSAAQDTTEQDTTAQDTDTSESSAQESTDSAVSAADTAMDAQYASVSVQAAKIRKGPSTDEGIVETLAEGTQVVVSGKSDGSDGKEWYYVTFTGADGSEKTGFVRYDLVSLGDLLPEEEKTTEQSVEETTQQTQDINNDFELKYEQDDEGGYAWYLYDNRDSQVASRQKLEPLLDAVDQAMSDASADTTDLAVKQRIVIVVLVVLLVVLVIAVIFMAFKLRDVYYEDYEDEDEEPEEEPVKPSRVKERSKSEPEKRTASKEDERAAGRRGAREEAPVRKRAEKKPVEQEVTYEEEPDVSVPVKSAPKRKSKNFLLDDDEFEFEFLNMDDKDLK